MYKPSSSRLLSGLLLPLVALCQQCRCLHGLFKHTPKSSTASEPPASYTDTGSSSSFGQENKPSLPLTTPPKVDKEETQDLAISDDDEGYISDFSTHQEESDESNMPELVKPNKKKEKPSTAPHAVFSFGPPFCWLETGLHVVAALFQDDIEAETPLGRLVKKIRTPALAPIPESDPDFQALINAVDPESGLSKDYRERKPSDPGKVWSDLSNYGKRVNVLNIKNLWDTLFRKFDVKMDNRTVSAIRLDVGSICHQYHADLLVSEDPLCEANSCSQLVVMGETKFFAVSFLPGTVQCFPFNFYKKYTTLRVEKWSEKIKTCLLGPDIAKYSVPRTETNGLADGSTFFLGQGSKLGVNLNLVK